ncbi:carboxypeptidase-like regulatory domain-containing protein [Nannocystis pusilla]|uniref:carboxypeptidase-like regulatory domain-containing protein n=1 Tax=Nannocystis pusilla TaxID=889268 RepID=UPI003B80AE48
MLIGVVRDASDGQGFAGAIVTVTGAKLQGERTMTTDAGGLYRIPDLPAGPYELTVVHPDFGGGHRGVDIELRAGATARVDVRLVRSRRAVVAIDVPSPTIDVGSSATGLLIDGQTAQRIPIAGPTTKGSANRSFEAIAEAVPARAATSTAPASPARPRRRTGTRSTASP